MLHSVRELAAGVCVVSRLKSCMWAVAQISPYQAFIGGRDFTANQFYNFFGPILGVPDASHGATEDLIADALVCASFASFLLQKSYECGC